MQRVLARAKPVGVFVQSTLAECNDDRVSRMAAALSYYSIFSAAPLLIIVVGLASLLLGRDAAQAQVMLQLRALVGDQLAEFIDGLAAQLAMPSAGLIATLVGVGALLMGAYGVLGALQDTFHTIWDVRPPPIHNLAAFAVERVWPLVLVVVVLLVIMMSVLLDVVFATANDRFGVRPPGFSVLEGLLSNGVIVGIFFLAFALTYRFLPAVRLGWRDVWIGALWSAVLFGIGRAVLNWYLATAGVGSIFGAAASLVVLLVWVNYSAQIFLIGAEITQVYARAHGSRQHERALLEQAGGKRPMIRSDRILGQR